MSQIIIGALYHLYLENSVWVCEMQSGKVFTFRAAEVLKKGLTACHPKANSLSSKIMLK